MAIAVVQEWEVGDDRSTENYDAIDARLQAIGVPSGLIVHSAGFDGDRFRVFDVWESTDAYERFASEHLQPAIEAVVPAGENPPDFKTYELHNVLTP